MENGLGSSTFAINVVTISDMGISCLFFHLGHTCQYHESLVSLIFSFYKSIITKPFIDFNAIVILLLVHTLSNCIGLYNELTKQLKETYLALYRTGIWQHSGLLD